jgi:F-type H+-transporting ATPase subunit alpha
VACIPTYLILTTNGQIVLRPWLFDLGLFAPIDVGQSVSRVGGKAQRAAYRAAGGDRNLRLRVVRAVSNLCPLRCKA